MKKVLIILSLLVFAILSMGAESSCETSSNDTAAPASGPGSAAEPLKVEMATMIADYDANQISANEKYAGKNVQLTGFVDNISTGLGGDVYVILHPTQEEFYVGTSIQCFTSEAEAKKLTNGQQATMTGKADEMSIGNIIIKDCLVK